VERSHLDFITFGVWPITWVSSLNLENPLRSFLINQFASLQPNVWTRGIKKKKRIGDENSKTYPVSFGNSAAASYIMYVIFYHVVYGDKEQC
jgi:hypothetical protein